MIIVKRCSLLMPSGLRKHTCAANDLLPFNMRIASDCAHSVTLALQQLQTLSRYRLKQLGFVDSNPVNVAVAAIRYVHLKARTLLAGNTAPASLTLFNSVVGLSNGSPGSKVTSYLSFLMKLLMSLRDLQRVSQQSCQRRKQRYWTTLSTMS